MTIRKFQFLGSLLLMLVAGFGCGKKAEYKAKFWSDGAWVLYDQTKIDAKGNKTTGTLRIAAVGSETLDQMPYYWIEIREDTGKGVKITKLLAAEPPAINISNGFKPWGEVKRIIIQENDNRPEEIPASYIKRFIPEFVFSSKSRRFGRSQDQAPPQVSDMPVLKIKIHDRELACPGKKDIRHYSSEVNLGFLHLKDESEMETEYYVHPKVPFGGIVKAHHKSTTISRNENQKDSGSRPPAHFENILVLKDFGDHGATTQITETPVEKEILPFPFLKKGKK